jgi:outer membrane protein OmpA-like peptidoglycan-associated protein
VRVRPLLLAILIGVTGACMPKHTSKQAHTGQSLVVLLPDADTGLPGRASVGNTSGSVDLAATRDATFVRTNSAPDPVSTLSEDNVNRIFGTALSALPPPLRHFTLYFRFDSNELTDESRALLRDVMAAVSGRAAPDVAIVGHTDTAGTPTANFQLGLKRATTVRNLLVTAGIDPSVIDVTSHGEADPLVRTPDETAEPRNRRVEISVR